MSGGKKIKKAAVLVDVKTKRYLEESQSFTTIHKLAKQLHGKRIAHISVSSRRGGVAQIIKNLIKFLKVVGVKVDWYTLPESRHFFNVSRNFRDVLQGKRKKVFKDDVDFYQKYQEKLASQIKIKNYSLIILHDYQTLFMTNKLGENSKLIWQFHLDADWDNIDQTIKEKIKLQLRHCDRYIFSAKDYIPNFINSDHCKIIPPAINPVEKKNISLSQSVINKKLKRLGIDPKKPILVQVDRFNPYKDQLGFLKAYHIAKIKHPDLQIVFVSHKTNTVDVEFENIYQKLKKLSRGDSNVFFFISKENNDDMVRLFQSCATVVVQKATKQGFGLAVTEAMWKSKAVIIAPTVGALLQVKNGKSGFVANNSKECAEFICQLVENQQLRSAIEHTSKEVVQKKFLFPRLVKDYLLIMNEALH